jgi:hypothetical protein
MLGSKNAARQVMHSTCMHHGVTTPARLTRQLLQHAPTCCLCHCSWCRVRVVNYYSGASKADSLARPCCCGIITGPGFPWAAAPVRLLHKPETAATVTADRVQMSSALTVNSQHEHRLCAYGERDCMRECKRLIAPTVYNIPRKLSPSTDHLPGSVLSGHCAPRLSLVIRRATSANITPDSRYLAPLSTL